MLRGQVFNFAPHRRARQRRHPLHASLVQRRHVRPARATLITGMYPPSTGAQNMRSEVTLPPHIRGYPEYLREAGYFCSNHVKHDYNWVAPKTMWDSNDADWKTKSWDLRTPGQPFFTVINITDTHSSQLYYRGEERYQKRLEVLSKRISTTQSESEYHPTIPTLWVSEMTSPLLRQHYLLR